MALEISVITPSYRMSPWLKLCVASVADQAGVDKEHIVQDAGSDDGTLDWLKNDHRVRAFVEHDEGMYDAINRGMEKAYGDIIGHLNSDEQYLPGALRTVADCFERHPDVDVLFADVLVIKPDGSLVSFQKVVSPTDWQIRLSHLPTYTAATFFRKRVIAEHGLSFRPNLKALADSYWVLNMLARQVPFAVLRHYVAAVTETGKNLSLGSVAQRESAQLYQSAPWYARALRSTVLTRHRLAKLLSGCYHESPLTYQLYTPDNLNQRTVFKAGRPSPFWWKMHRHKNTAYYTGGTDGGQP